VTLTLKLVHNVARVVEYPRANFGDFVTIHCQFMGYWALAHISGWGEMSSLSIDSLQQQVLLLRQLKLTNNCFLATKF